MDADQKEICIYLKSMPGQFVSGREIARRAACKRRFREDPNWAAAGLAELVDQGLIESDSTGHYRLPVRQSKEADPAKKWISPQLKKILEKSGKDFTHVIAEEELEGLSP